MTQSSLSLSLSLCRSGASYEMVSAVMLSKSNTVDDMGKVAAILSQLSYDRYRILPKAGMDGS